MSLFPHPTRPTRHPPLLTHPFFQARIVLTLPLLVLSLDIHGSLKRVVPHAGLDVGIPIRLHLPLWKRGLARQALLLLFLFVLPLRLLPLLPLQPLFFLALCLFLPAQIPIIFLPVRQLLVRVVLAVGLALLGEAQALPGGLTLLRPVARDHKFFLLSWGACLLALVFRPPSPTAPLLLRPPFPDISLISPARPSSTRAMLC